MISRGAAFRQHPGGAARMATAAASAFAAAQRMGHGIHGHTTNVRAPTHMPRSTGLTQRDVLVLRVADAPNGRTAFNSHLPHLARGQYQRRPIALTGQQPSRGSRTANQLAALPGIHFNVVNIHTNRNSAQGHRIARHRLGITPIANDVARLQSDRSENVAQFAVLVPDQCNVATPVGVIMRVR